MQALRSEAYRCVPSSSSLGVTLASVLRGAVHLRLSEFRHGSAAAHYVTRPFRIAADLLAENEDPEAVAQITVDVLREVQDYARTFVDALAPLSSRLAFKRDSGRTCSAGCSNRAATSRSPDGSSNNSTRSPCRHEGPELLRIPGAFRFALTARIAERASSTR